MAGQLGKIHLIHHPSSHLPLIIIEGIYSQMWKNKIKKAKQAEPSDLLTLDGTTSNGSGLHDNHISNHHDSDDIMIPHHHHEDDYEDDFGGMLHGKRLRNENMNENENNQQDNLNNNDNHVNKRSRQHDNYAIEPPSASSSSSSSSIQQQSSASQSLPEPIIPPPIHYQPYEQRSSKASKRDQNWDAQFEALLAYANKHKHCNVRTGYSSNNEEEKPNINLYAWLALQRRHKKQNKLRPDREKKLQSLVDAGLLSWSGSDPLPRHSSGDDEGEYIHVLPPPPPPSWDSHFHELLIYAEIHGHANVPTGYFVTVDKRKDIDLGIWLDEQRKLYGKKVGNFDATQALHYQKLNLLVDEGRFAWQAPRQLPIIPAHILDIKWSYRYEAMRSYINQDGNHHACLGDNINAKLVVPVPDVNAPPSSSSGTPIGGPVEIFDLGLWVLAQRKCYAAGSLDERRKNLLQALVDSNQFTWQSPEEAARLSAEDMKRQKEEEALWNAWYNALVWQGNHVGHCNLDSHGTITLPDGSEAELGKWLHIQRTHIKKGRLRLDRAKKIRKLYDEGKLDEEKWGHIWTLTYPPGTFDENPVDARGTSPTSH